MMMTTDSIVDDFGDYLIYEKRLSDKTREAYCRELVSFLGYLDDKNIAPDRILPSELEDYILFRRTSVGLEDSTISRIIATLRSFYKYLESKDMVWGNPARFVDKPKSKKHLPKTLTENEVDDLLESIKDDDLLSIRDWCIFEVIYSTGLRISETVSLNVSSFSFDDSTMRVIGKRGKERVVFVGDKAKDSLFIYLSEVRPKLISPKNKREDAMFLNRRGKRMTRQAMHKRFHERTEALGLDATVHTLRHSFASHMMMNGADVRSVQEMLGHADIKTTQIYTHFDTSSLLSIFDKYAPLGDCDD